MRLDARPLLPVVGRVHFVGRDAGRFVFDLLFQDEVEEDGEEAGYCAWVEKEGLVCFSRRREREGWGMGDGVWGLGFGFGIWIWDLGLGG